MRDDCLISAEALQRELAEKPIRLVDGSWYMPASGRDARAEYEAAHIPGAVFFDIERHSDQSSDLPHMLPSAADFAKAAGALGLAESDDIVVYDGAGLFSAARVWWTFRAFGAARVRVLDGGLPAWKSAGGALENGSVRVNPAAFHASFNPEVLADFTALKATVKDGSAKILDARSQGRFEGTSPEPRPGLPSGHMPGALNLPFDQLLDAQGKMKDSSGLRQAFAARGVSMDDEIITSCGSGVTAAITALALAAEGAKKVRLYDGSWSEWGAHPEASIVRKARE